MCVLCFITTHKTPRCNSGLSLGFLHSQHTLQIIAVATHGWIWED
jgi:hypothetical protein